MSKVGDPKPWDNIAFLTQKYVTEQLSTQQIAAEVNTFPNTIRRALIRHGIPLRDKSVAQKNYLSENAHPMQGRERSEDERRRISKGVQDNWEKLSEPEAEKRKEDMSARAKAKWDWMSQEEKDENLKKMQKAIRASSTQGSKNENLVAQLLKEAGYPIVQRTNDYSPQNAFEIDMAIPGINVAIEWDGAAHFEAIYGDDSLTKTMEKDRRKDKALTNFGWTLIRCRDHSTAHSLAFCQRATAKIIEVIKAITPVSKRQVHYVDAT